MNSIERNSLSDIKYAAGILLATCLLALSALAQSPVTLTITNSPGCAIPDDFTGLSFGAVAELPGTGGVSGDFFCGTNTQLITLFGNSGLHHLRLGGTTVEGPNAAVPGRTDIDNVFAFAKAANVKVIYSLPLLNADSTTDAQTAQYIWQRYRPLLDCFAIGNEPDTKRFHNSPDGTGTDPDITNDATCLEKWKKIAVAVTNAAPGATIAGPDAAGQKWAQTFARDVKESGLVTLITQHEYVGGRPYINKDGPERIPVRTAIDNMLSEKWAATKYPTFYTNAVLPVVNQGLPYRMTEADDYLKGITNASDSFASALWALDYLHWWAAHGCSGVNFHNTEWLKTDTVFFDSSTGTCQSNPKAYGIKAFDLGSHGRVEPVSIGNAEGLNLTAYAVGNTTALFVTIINKEHNAGARDAVITIVPAGFPFQKAAVMCLAAENGDVGARKGITLGGAPITNHSIWVGKWTKLKFNKSAQCGVKVPAGSAAIVKIYNTY